MTPRPFPRSGLITVNWFADLFALAAVIALGLLFLLWGFTRTTPLNVTIPFPDTSVSFCSENGRIMVGIFENERPMLWTWWGRRRGASLNDLQSDPTSFLTADLGGWGIAMPHALLALIIAIVPAWWWIIARTRAEEKHRLTFGLCRQCGYDLRESPERCPECGTVDRKSATMGGLQPPSNGSSGSAMPNTEMRT